MIVAGEKIQARQTGAVLLGISIWQLQAAAVKFLALRSGLHSPPNATEPAEIVNNMPARLYAGKQSFGGRFHAEPNLV